MKAGISLRAMAAEIMRQKDLKEDYLVDTRNLQMETSGGGVLLRVLDGNRDDVVEPFDVGEIAHRQIGTHLGIPAKYYAKMLEEKPGLLCTNVNSWMEANPTKRMLRTLGGRARAFLSNRYLRLDHYDVASAVIPVLEEMPDAQFESCQITEGRLYIKVVNPRLQAEVEPGDIVQSGVIISEENSTTNLARLLDKLNSENALPRLILFNLNPKMNTELMTLLGCFQDESARGKVQYGPAWWFLDNKVGMEKHLEDLTATGHIGAFVGMLTDSRSLLSYPRHHYFRRILCNYFGKMMEDGLMTVDETLVGGVVRDICFENAKEYFGI